MSPLNPRIETPWILIFSIVSHFLSAPCSQQLILNVGGITVLFFYRTKSWPLLFLPFFLPTTHYESIPKCRVHREHGSIVRSAYHPRELMTQPYKYISVHGSSKCQVFLCKFKVHVHMYVSRNRFQQNTRKSNMHHTKRDNSHLHMNDFPTRVKKEVFLL